jgi:hypothetical protein
MIGRVEKAYDYINIMPQKNVIKLSQFKTRSLGQSLILKKFIDKYN